EDATPIDEDVELMKHVLDQDSSSEDMAPVMIGHDFLEDFRTGSREEILEKITAAHRKLSKDFDILVIEGARTSNVLSHLDLSSISLAKIFNSSILIVSKGSDDSILDGIVHQKKVADSEGCPVVGCVLNNIPRPFAERADKVVRVALEENDIKILGIIPEEKILGYPTVEAVHDFIGGDLIEGKDLQDKLIEGIYIGALSTEGARQYYRDFKDKALITGGDRADMAVAGIEAGVSLLVLTGNLYPPNGVLTLARLKKVPIILVPYDTFTTVKRLNAVTGRVKLWDKRKLDVYEETVSELIDWKYVLQKVKETD
ncbi:MAG: DRTGG domain-containing protein, partial [Halobacteriota archaeon]|nr:DRTGG domain-containing protein [Halobacteriota archaeon]